MTNRLDWLGWGVALILSLSLHTVLMLQKNLNLVKLPADTASQHITHIRFSSIAAPTPAIQPEPLTSPEPESITPSKPVIKTKARPQAEVKKTVEVKPEPVKKTKTPHRPPKQKKTDIKRTTAVKSPPSGLTKSKPNQNINKQVPFADIISQQVLKEKYQALLLRHIEAHKIYPKSARRRKTEGRIKVSFILSENGSISQLQVEGKRRILKKASKTAVNNALPMPAPPHRLSLPIKVEFSMNYFLQ